MKLAPGAPVLHLCGDEQGLGADVSSSRRRQVSRAWPSSIPAAPGRQPCLGLVAGALGSVLVGPVPEDVVEVFAAAHDLPHVPPVGGRLVVIEPWRPLATGLRKPYRPPDCSSTNSIGPQPKVPGRHDVQRGEREVRRRRAAGRALEGSRRVPRSSTFGLAVSSQPRTTSRPVVVLDVELRGAT